MAWNILSRGLKETGVGRSVSTPVEVAVSLFMSVFHFVDAAFVRVHLTGR